ncbi:anti-sigma factor [Pseudochrobactrum sp. sp1633]|uniref:anti-sigma factor family protein n=1 Tax=Pseudochrobactrum sp. sp1633 TaxID=3036706 RepID=UPI0025A573E6|nr:anti-sigma factor [Pseudochrobactrum sp. sp1633]MDM8346714.1 anti-sigma factor [Pseudochrobactrum sp. sp1633]
MTQSQPHNSFSDEELMAFADGELDEATTARIEAAMEHDDALITRVALFMETRATAQEALRPMLDEPVPDALLAAVQGMVTRHEQAKQQSATAEPFVVQVTQDEAEIIPFRAKPRKPLFAANWSVAAAAALLAAVTGLSGYFIGQSGVQAPQTGGTELAALTAPAVQAQLQNTASGQTVTLAEQNATMQITASFRDGQNHLCREFRLSGEKQSGYVAVSCYEQEAWQLRFALASQQDTQSYIPASAQETVDVYLSSINAGAPLSDEEEKAALKQ